MKKKILLVLLIIVVISVISMCYILVNKEYYKFDSEKNPSVYPNQEFENVLNITLKYSAGNLIDGGIKFGAYDMEYNKLIETFNYKPWEGKIPVCQTMDNGDIILGSKWILKHNENRVEYLNPVIGQSLLDYSIREDRIALIGYSEDKQNVDVNLFNISGRHLLLIDSFKFPAFLNPPTVFISLGKDGLVYYDCCQDNTPVVKVYDPKDNTFTVFREFAMMPQISPDGEFMVLQLTDSYCEEEQHFKRMCLIELDKKETIAWLPNLGRIFWDDDFMINYDYETQELALYLLKTGQIIEEIAVQGLPFEVKIRDGFVHIKTYHGEEDRFILSSEKVKLQF